MHSIELVPYTELEPKEIGSVLHAIASIHGTELRQQGFRRLATVNKILSDAVTSADAIREDHKAGTMSAYVLRSTVTRRFVGVGSILPHTVDLHAPLIPLFSALPAVAQRLFQADRVVVSKEKSVNVTAYVDTVDPVDTTSPFRLRMMGVGHRHETDAISELSLLAEMLHPDLTQWALVPPASTKEAAYVDAGFTVGIADRYNEHEGIRGILPVMSLATKQAVL